MELLGDIVFQPILDENVIAHTHESIRFELQELDKKPDPEPVMTELIHEVGFYPYNTVYLSMKIKCHQRGTLVQGFCTDSLLFLRFLFDVSALFFVSTKSTNLQFLHNTFDNC